MEGCDMVDANLLAIEAVIVGLRRSGTIDRRTVQLIAEAMLDASQRLGAVCPESAGEVKELATSIASRSGRCLAHSSSSLHCRPSH
jgi:hypothetical protein